MNVKSEKVATLLVKEISEIIRFEARDEILKDVTITYVNVTSDLSIAKVYYNILDKKELVVIQKVLDNAAGYVRSELAKRVELRHIPELKFIYDESIEYGEKIEKILEEIS